MCRRDTIHPYRKTKKKKKRWSRSELVCAIENQRKPIISDPMQLAVDSLHQITCTIITNCLFVLYLGSSFHDSSVFVLGQTR